MEEARDLCTELFSWIAQQEQYAGYLKDLAAELEDITKTKCKHHMTFSLVTAGIAGMVLASPAAVPLVEAGCFLVGRNTLNPLTNKIVKKWKSSKTMKAAEKIADEIERIQNNIERLQKKLSEDCEIQGFKASSSEEVQCEITARVLKAMAEQRGRNLPLNYLRQLLRNNDITSKTVLGPTFFQNVGVLLAVLGNFFLLKTIKQTDQVQLTTCYVHIFNIETGYILNGKNAS